MRVDSERLEILFKKADQVRAEISMYSLAGDKIPVSVDDLEDAVRRMYSVRIEAVLVPVRSQFVQSMMERFNNGLIRIVVKTSLPHDEKRFSVTKELSHVILDEKEDWSCDVGNTIAELLEFTRIDVDTNGDHETTNRVIIAENLASFLALEILYPPDRRDVDFVALQSSDPKTSLAKLALYYELPIKVIETAHAGWYRELRMKCAQK
jgi:Zn-dependent peptidase ImmA (M78 family)